MMASIDSGATPMRASLATVSRMPKPQSISSRVSPASTSRPLPSLPLPRQAKRTLLELILEQRENLLAVRRTVRDTRRILHRYQAAGVGLRHDDPILLRRLRLVGLPELQLVQRILEPALVLFLLGEIRIRIADKIETLRTVAIDDRKAGAIEREPDAAPRAVERILDDQLRLAVAALFDMRLIGPVGHRRHRRRGFGCRRAESQHQALEKLGLELGIRWKQRPLPVFTRPLRKLGRQLRRAAMADKNLDRPRLGTALDPAAKLVALVGIVAEAHIFTGKLLQEILRQVGAILGPIGFHDAKRRLIDSNHEPVPAPEIAQRRPGRLLCGLHHQPPLAARARETRIRAQRQKLGRAAGRARGGNTRRS